MHIGNSFTEILLHGIIMLNFLFHRKEKWKVLSAAAVSFKLRKFKCKIAKKKKMKVKLIAEILTISLCDENHLKDVAYT